MNYKIITPATEWSESKEDRHWMFLSEISRLQYLAYIIKCSNALTNETMITVCIDVESEWRWLVDILVPYTNWQTMGMFEARPLAVCTSSFSICKDVAKKLPDIKDSIMEKPNAGHYKCIVLNDGGGTVYEIKPVKQKMQ